MLPPTWRHQQRELEDNGDREKLMLLWSPRTGKSRAALDWLLRHLEGSRKAIIVGPLVVCPQWIKLLQEAGKTAFSGYSKSGGQITTWLKANKEGIIVINDDKLAKLIEPLLKWKPDIFIGDESHRYRSPSSARGRAVRRICWQTPNVRLLTGTPTPNNVGNLWGQMVCIDKNLWGSSFTQFANKFLIRDAVFPSKILGIRHSNKIREMLLSCSSIIRREDIFGPDHWQEIIREVELPSKARKLYEDLVKKWIVEDSMGLKEIIDVTHKLKRIIRLQQLTSGFISDENGTLHQVHTAKYDAVINDLEEIIESGEKVVIFHQFTEEGNSLYERIKSEYGSEKVYRISGQVGGEQRAQAIHSFESSKTGSVIIVQTQAGGIGISLASAVHAFFISQGFNFDVEQQARDRIYSPRSRKCVTYYRVMGSVDGYIAKVLENKEDFHNSVTHADLRELAFNEKVLKPNKGVI